MIDEIIKNKLKISAARLKELRLRSEMSLSDFANAVDVSAPTIKRYEDGQRVPDLTFLQKVSERFLVSLEWLAGSDVDEKKSEQEVLALYNRLPSEYKRLTIVYMTALLEEHKKKE